MLKCVIQTTVSLNYVDSNMKKDMEITIENAS
jgi:hypothetical protein